MRGHNICFHGDVKKIKENYLRIIFGNPPYLVCCSLWLYFLWNLPNLYANANYAKCHIASDVITPLSNLRM